MPRLNTRVLALRQIPADRFVNEANLEHRDAMQGIAAPAEVQGVWLARLLPGHEV